MHCWRARTISPRFEPEPVRRGMSTWPARMGHSIHWRMSWLGTISIRYVHPTKTRLTQQLVSFSHEHPGQLRLQEALEYEARESDDVATARETMKRAADVFVATMDKHGLDVLVWPTSKGSFIATAGDFPSVGQWCWATLTMQCTAPIGVKADGCPYGVSAVARRDQEDSLVRFM